MNNNATYNLWQLGGEQGKSFNPCGAQGHDFVICAPTRIPEGQRIYDLICARCGEYREVRSA